MTSQRATALEMGRYSNDGLPLRVKIVKTQAWFEDLLPSEYRGVFLPNYMAQLRNMAIIALFTQTLSTVAGYSFFLLRRNRFYLVVNTVSLLLTCLGFFGVLKFKKYQTAFHGVTTTAILGVFFAYSLLEVFLRSDLREVSDSLRFSEFGTVFLLSLPYLVDFISGCFTFYLAYRMFELDEEKQPRSKVEVREDQEYDFPETYDIYSNICAICFTRPKECVIYRCGHKATCRQCSEDLRKSGSKKCPLCRGPIEDIIYVYS
eukprot:TRINITY_DN13691_c0_g1_i1.p1 TRINITY_DN13691_c0_g1~~TRINITY_DN13691_c0_g1_i1.p1  ORF type:complete len:261 (-),score=20.84 TRINITY_DN13691_c0_g1_i1:158-940(-)